MYPYIWFKYKNLPEYVTALWRFRQFKILWHSLHINNELQKQQLDFSLHLFFVFLWTLLDLESKSIEMVKDGAQLSEDSSVEESIELSEGGEGGGRGEEDEKFYEEIEAPKFVDFTVPDQCRPDDRYWFCLRVGQSFFNP